MLIALLVVAVIWAIVASMLVYRNPLPIPDWGHQCFEVPSEAAAQAVTSVLAKDGLGENFTFNFGPTRQTLLADGHTVIFQARNDELGGLPGNARSVVVKNPLLSAAEASRSLQENGFTAVIHRVVDVGVPSGSLIVVSSDAFKNWVLVYRWHALKLGAPKRESIFKQ
jgi:hypothetical protein